MTITDADLVDLRGLSLWQPWASLVGPLKPIETRPRSVGLRVGQTFAVHAALTRIDRRLYGEVMAEADPDPATWPLVEPLGCIVSLARVADFRRAAGGIPSEWLPMIADRGRAFALGDFRAGRVLYLLRDVVTLPEPVPCVGRQGLFRIPAEAVAEIRSQLFPRPSGAST